MSFLLDEDALLMSSVAAFFTSAGIFDSVETQLLALLAKPEFRFAVTQRATQLRGTDTAYAVNDVDSERRLSLLPVTNDDSTPSADFHFLLLDVSLDPLYLMSHSPRLFLLLVSRPRDAERLFARVISASLGSRVVSPTKFSSDEILVRFCLPFLPALPPSLPSASNCDFFFRSSASGGIGDDIFRVSRLADVVESESLGLFRLRGTVVALTSPVDYVTAAKFVCDNSKCLFGSGRMNIWHVMRFGDAELDPQAPFKACLGCGKRMTEDATRRCIGEKVSLMVVPETEDDGRGGGGKGGSAQSSTYRQAIRVIVRESFCNCSMEEDFRLGRVVEIVGFASKNVKIWRDVGLAVEAVSVVATKRKNRYGDVADSPRNDDESRSEIARMESKRIKMLMQMEERVRTEKRWLEDGLMERVEDPTGDRLVPTALYLDGPDASQHSLFSSLHSHDVDDHRRGPPPGLDRLPDSILHLLTSSSSSPWRFTWSLAYCAASAVAPRETFHRLKLMLLLALVVTKSGGDDVEEEEEEEERRSSRACMDILVCGGETEFIDRILTYFGKNLAPKYVKHSVLSACIVRKTSSTFDSTPTTVYEAGSLHLARGGICHLGYLPRLKKSDQQLLKHAVESRDSGGIAASSSSSSPVEQQKSDCSLWAYCDPVVGKSLSTSVGVTPNADYLGNVFELKIFTDSSIPGIPEAVDAFLADFILNGTPSPSSIFSPLPPYLPLLSAADLKQFLVYASASKPELTPEAKSLITGYYVYSRKRRCGGAASSFGATASSFGGTGAKPASVMAFPASSISTLTTLAVAHAKLRINHEANVGDALAAILLFEESVTLHSGVSLFDVLPLHHLLGPDSTPADVFDAESWLGAGNDVIFARLKERVTGILEGQPEMDFGRDF